MRKSNIRDWRLVIRGVSVAIKGTNTQQMAVVNLP